MVSTKSLDEVINNLHPNNDLFILRNFRFTKIFSQLPDQLTDRDEVLVSWLLVVLPTIPLFPLPDLGLSKIFIPEFLEEVALPPEVRECPIGVCASK